MCSPGSDRAPPFQDFDNKRTHSNEYRSLSHGDYPQPPKSPEGDTGYSLHQSIPYQDHNLHREDAPGQVYLDFYSGLAQVDKASGFGVLGCSDPLDQGDSQLAGKLAPRAQALANWAVD
jgi:hypothetical protein